MKMEPRIIVFLKKIELTEASTATLVKIKRVPQIKKSEWLLLTDFVQTNKRERWLTPCLENYQFRQGSALNSKSYPLKIRGLKPEDKYFSNILCFQVFYTQL